MNIFEENISYDFMTEDMLQTSFATTGPQQNTCVEKTTKLPNRFGKRDNTEIHVDEEQLLKKTKSDLQNYRFPRTPVRRKFPGPAGLLPDDYVENKSISEIFQSNKSNNEIFVCSQQNFSDFAKGPWQKMVADFQDTQRELLFEKFNINWIKAHFSDKKQIKNYKAPFLACTLDNLELIDGKIPTVKVVLKDKTGTIQGTILHSLYEEYSRYFTVESVLILKQFGVLSAHNSYCLTITPNNLLSIYYIDTLSDDEKKESKSPKVEKVVLQEHSIESIWATYESQISGYKSDTKISLYDRNLGFVNKSNLNTVCVKNENNKNPSIFKNVGKEPNLENFKEIPKNVKPCSIVTCINPISVTSDKADMKVWEDLFKEVDADAFFDEF